MPGIAYPAVTVYVVDDDDSIRRALKRLLRSVGYHALTFASAEEFLEFAPEPGEGCIVLDIRLSGMTGFDLQEKLASRGPKYPVIFMTAHDNPHHLTLESSQIFICRRLAANALRRS